MGQSKVWDDRFIRLARYWATLCSKDPTTKVGAVIVGVDRRKMALGYNGFPPGVSDYPDRLADRDTKHKLIQHAERNCLDNAAFEVSGGTLYCTMFPCSECVKSAASKGIARIVCPPPVSYEPWSTDAGFSRLIANEAGIAIDLMP